MKALCLHTTTHTRQHTGRLMLSAALTHASVGTASVSQRSTAALTHPSRAVHTHSSQRSAFSVASESKQSRPLLLTLERSVGGSFGSEAELRRTGAFQAEVFPDLPTATTWGGVWKKLSNAFQGAAPPKQESKEVLLQGEADVQPGALKVMTVAANLRSLPTIESRIRAVASTSGREENTSDSNRVKGLGIVSGRPADALLLVSGSHPVRSLPGSKLLLPSSLSTLDAATRLRTEGAIPESVQLWAVANPNVEENAALVEQKAERGATVILTQPPFDVERFYAWVEDARKRGVWETARLVVGHPMISSTGNLAFWMTLSSCLGRPACQELLREFSSAEASGDKQAFQELCAQFNQRLVEQALEGGDASGFHLMPITTKGKNATQGALAAGGFLADL